MTQFQFDKKHLKYRQTPFDRPKKVKRSNPYLFEWADEPIAPKENVVVRTPAAPKVELNQDAVLALETLGVPRNEAKRQILEAIGISPEATTQELIILCLKGK